MFFNVLFSLVFNPVLAQDIRQRMADMSADDVNRFLLGMLGKLERRAAAMSHDDVAELASASEMTFLKSSSEPR